ncbi:MAG: RluA family pseudouridine synthase [Longimicrobiales bacterium]
MGADRWVLVVDAPGAERLDRYIAEHLPDLSRSRVTQLLDDGRVRLNGRLPRKSERPAPGDRIEIEIPAAEPSPLPPEDIPLRIIFEDEALLIVDKPAGIVVHPGPGHRSGTLVNALLHHVGDLSGIGGVQRPGIVHRLDKDTSGLMIVAKHDRAHRALSAALKRRAIRRRYLVACWGHLGADARVVEGAIGRSGADRKRMAVRDDGQPARTRLERLERWRAADLVRAGLDSGRTHQIRVHLEWIGHPVVGDATYGGGGARRISGPDRGWADTLERRVPRQFLHAAELELEHPLSGETLRFESRLPTDLAAAAAWARESSMPGADR